MTKYTYAEKVVTKVKKLLAHDVRFRDMLNTQPQVNLDVRFCLESIVWTYYDYSLILTSNRAIFSNRGQSSVLMQFADFDNFLAL